MSVAEARKAWPEKFLWLHPPLGWFLERRPELMKRIREMVRDAGPRRFCLMISEEVPENWREQVPAVLETLGTMCSNEDIFGHHERRGLGPAIKGKT